MALVYLCVRILTFFLHFYNKIDNKIKIKFIWKLEYTKNSFDLTMNILNSCSISFACHRDDNNFILIVFILNVILQLYTPNAYINNNNNIA